MTTRGRPRRGLALAAAVLAGLSLSACSSDRSGQNTQDEPGGRPENLAAGTPAPTSRYAVFPGGVPATGWELRESQKSVGNDRQSELGSLPGVDWYAEFEQPGTDQENVPYLSLTGYTQPLDQLRAAIPATAQLSTGDIAGHQAFWGSDPADPDVGSFVTLNFGAEYSIELFATYVPLEDLLTWAGSLSPATEAEWAAAGANP